MLIKKWCEKTPEIISCSLCICYLIVCSILLIVESLDPVTVKVLLSFIIATFCFPACLLMDSLEKVYVFEDRIEIKSFGKIKKEIKFIDIDRILFCHMGVRKAFALLPNAYYHRDDRYVRLRYNKKTWLLINTLLEKNNINPATEEVAMTMRGDANKFSGYVVIGISAFGLSMALMLLTIKGNDTSIGASLLMFGIFVLFLLISISSLTDDVTIDCQKIEYRGYFRKICVTKGDLKKIVIIDKENVIQAFRYIAYVIPNTVSDYELKGLGKKQLNKKLKRDKRVIPIPPTDTIKRYFESCGWEVEYVA